MKMKAEGRYTA